jgi:beta-phosphoglucomutase-like phosphatase (HAD superfamily)
MLSLLAEIYSTFPEKGDSDQPELIMFIDEAHLIFDTASKALLGQIENIVKLIRSKGKGLYFVTQNPTDIPEGVLSQLGLKIQHALRALTAKDRKAIKLTAQNYPETDYYDTAGILTSLRIGEALISALDEKGRPSPLAVTMLRAPEIRINVLTDRELIDLIADSELTDKYNEDIDRESAEEMLQEKTDKTNEDEIKEKAAKEKVKTSRSSSSRTSSRQNPIIKVLTSASFILGIMGDLRQSIQMI